MNSLKKTFSMNITNSLSRKLALIERYVQILIINLHCYSMEKIRLKRSDQKVNKQIQETILTCQIIRTMQQETFRGIKSILKIYSDHMRETKQSKAKMIQDQIPALCYHLLISKILTIIVIRRFLEKNVKKEFSERLVKKIQILGNYFIPIL